MSINNNCLQAIYIFFQRGHTHRLVECDTLTEEDEFCFIFLQICVSYKFAQVWFGRKIMENNEDYQNDFTKNEVHVTSKSSSLFRHLIRVI